MYGPRGDDRARPREQLATRDTRAHETLAPSRPRSRSLFAQPAGVPPERPVRPDHPMTRPYDKQRIPPDRGPHGPHPGSGGADLLGDLTVRHRHAVRNGVQRLPDPPLEVAAAGHVLDVEACQRALEVRVELSGDRVERLRSPVPAVLDDGRALLSRQGERSERGAALRCGGFLTDQQQFAQRTVERRVHGHHSVISSQSVQLSISCSCPRERFSACPATEAGRIRTRRPRAGHLTQVTRCTWVARYGAGNGSPPRPRTVLPTGSSRTAARSRSRAPSAARSRPAGHHGSSS